MSLTGGAVALALAAAAAGAPAAGDGVAVRFAVKGDWGDGTPAQAAVTRRMCAEARRAPFAFVATTGDNFSAPDGVATDANFTRPERCLIALGVTWVAAWGNHDAAGTGTADALGSPRRWRALARGPLLLLVLDGNRPDDPDQLRFIRRTLGAARQPVRIAVYHQPVRTAGPHAPSDTARRLWEPLFREGGVTLALQGHNHLYERIEAGGLTYVTTGGGGAQTYPCVRLADGLRSCALDHHFLIVEVTPAGAALRAVTPRGRTIERVVVPARA